MFGVDDLPRIDVAGRADEGVIDPGAFANADAMHQDGVLANRAFIDEDLAGDDAMAHFAKDRGALVDQAILDHRFAADVLRGAVGVFGIDLVGALDGVKVGGVVLLEEKVHVRRVERGDGADVAPIAIIAIGDHLLLLGKYLQDDVLAVEGDSVIAVNLEETEVIKIMVDNGDPAVIAKVCYEIGNRHAPLFRGEDEKTFLTPFNGPMLTMIEKIPGLTTDVVEAKFNFETRISASVSSHTH